MTGRPRLVREASAGVGPTDIPAPNGGGVLGQHGVTVAPTSYVLERYYADGDHGLVFDTVSWAWRLRGKLLLAAVEATLNDLVHRHEILRTAFRPIGGQVLQVIRSELVVPTPVVDLTRARGAARWRTVSRLATDDVERPFDLETAPLLGATLVRLGPEEQILLWRVCHAIWDAGSRTTFTRDWARFYRARSVGREPRVEAAPLQFADWASWERGQSHPAEARSYWRDTLDGFSPSSGLADRPRAPGSDGYVAGEVVPDPLSSALADVLERHGRPHGVGLHGALLAALIVALSFSSDRDDFTIGVIDGNRDRPECEALLGCLASLVLLRVALEPELSFRELLRRTGSAWRRARRHKVPLEQQLPDGWTRPLEPSDPPICEVKFNYLPAPATSGRETWTELAPGLHVHTFSPDVKRRTWSSPSSWFGTLLTVTVWRRPDAQLGLVLGYNQSRLSPERVAGVARGLSAVLRLAATHPELSLRELSRRVAACGVAEGER